MTEARVPVDLFNPGQVFACLGLVEACEVLCGETQATFDWSNETDTHFIVRTKAQSQPVEEVLRFLEAAEVVAEAPSTRAHLSKWNKKWGRVNVLPKDSPYPFPEPDSPATWTAVLCAGGKRLVLDHWGDTTRDNVKFWAGAGGYPGSALARDALALVRGKCMQAVSNPFALGVPQSSSFRLDWRRDYIPIDAGFSLNAHSGGIEAVGYPLVELLGALGLTHARPKRVRKLEYHYAVLGAKPRGVAEGYPASLLRAALGGSPLPFPMRHFRMQLGWPGKEGQARAITTVTQESQP